MSKRKILAERSGEDPQYTVEGKAQADAVLAELGEYERELLAVQNERAEKIADAQAAYKDAELELQLRIQAAKEALAMWYRGEFGESGSIKLNHGTMGYRQSSVVETPEDEVGLLKALKARGLEHCIKTTEKPLKEALRDLPGKVLGSLGVRVVTKAAFYVKAITPDTRQGGS